VGLTAPVPRLRQAAAAQMLRLPKEKTSPPKPIRANLVSSSCAAYSSVLPIFFQGYNQDAAWRAIFAENLCLNPQKDPL
jgi:hypothetical protein